MFGAITSKPVKAAEKELVPALQGKSLVYRSPIVRMRQLFDLYICLRPIKAYPQNPLNFKEGIDLVVFRENTEDLYSGVEFNTVPDRLRDTLAELSPPFKAFKDLPGDQYAISCQVFHTTTFSNRPSFSTSLRMRWAARRWSIARSPSHAARTALSRASGLMSLVR